MCGPSPADVALVEKHGVIGMELDTACTIPTGCYIDVLEVYRFSHLARRVLVTDKSQIY